MTSNDNDEIPANCTAGIQSKKEDADYFFLIFIIQSKNTFLFFFKRISQEKGC